MNTALVEARHHAPDLAALPGLGDEVGQVEEAALEEQHEGHPLVVRLVRHLVPRLVKGAHSGAYGGFADFRVEVVGHGEGSLDVAVLREQQPHSVVVSLICALLKNNSNINKMGNSFNGPAAVKWFKF